MRKRHKDYKKSMFVDKSDEQWFYNFVAMCIIIILLSILLGLHIDGYRL